MIINNEKRERLLYIELPKLLLEILLESMDIPIEMKMVDFTIEEMIKQIQTYIGAYHAAIRILATKEQSK